VYLIPLHLLLGARLTWDNFWGSFHLYTSILDMAIPRLGTNSLWDRIPWQPCSEQKWVKDLPSTDPDKTEVSDFGLCMKPMDIVKTAGANYAETLPIMGGKVNGSKRLMIDIYKCIAGGASPTPNVPLACDGVWFGSTILLKVFEKTVNIKNYEEPIKFAHREFDRFIPTGTTLRFETDLEMKWVELYTDIGALAKEWEVQPTITIQGFKKTTNVQSLANIQSNYLSQGKVIMADFLYHMEVSTSNEKTEIYRYYYTVIDVFSAVGGL